VERILLYREFKMLIKKQNIQGNIMKLYMYNVLLWMFFFIPVMVLFYQDKGLTMTEIMLLQSVYAMWIVILEIPTGYLADMYSRKKVLIYASVFWLLGMVIYSFAGSFYDFILWELVLAISISLSSGAFSAFVYDTLIELKKEHNFKKIWGNIQFYWMLSLSFSSVIWGIIANHYGFEMALYMGIPFFFLALVVAFTFVEPSRNKPVIQQNYVKELGKIVRVNLVKNHKLRWIIIYSGIVYALSQASLWLYQPYFQLIELDLVYFGIVFATFQVVAAFSSKYAYKIEQIFWEKGSLVSLVFLLAISYMLMSNFIFLFSFIFAFLHQFIRWFKSVIVTDYVNKLTLSENRATILSIESFVSRIIYASLIPGIGYMVDVFSLIQALQLLAIMTFLSGIIVVFFLKKNKVI